MLPVLEAELGPGIAEALARTAAQLREDAEAFDEMIDETIEDIVEHAEAGISVSAAALAANPAALRHRIIRHVVAARVRREPHPRADPRGRAARDGLVGPGADRPARMPRPARRRTIEFTSRAAEHARLRSDPCAPPTSRASSPRSSSPRSRFSQSSRRSRRRSPHDYEGKDLLLVGVLKGAIMVMADFSRALPTLVPMDWMAVSSYGAGTQSSGVVQIRKDLDTDLHGKHVLIVEDIIDSGLTLSWLLKNFASRGAASVEVFALLRKPDAAKVQVDCSYVGFDIPNEFVVGYGLDYAEKYRNLRDVAVLAPHVYA